MTDLAATMGCDSLKEFSKIHKPRQKIYNTYLKLLKNNKKVKCIHDFDKNKTHGAWLLQSVENKDTFKKADIL